MIQSDAGVGGRLPSLYQAHAARPSARLMRRAAMRPDLQVCHIVDIAKKEHMAMATTSGPISDVLHSENHSKLSAEEIAKAVERHNKKHPAAKAENPSKTNKACKK